MENNRIQIKKDQLIHHCKKCRGPLMKNLNTENMDGAVSFKMMCPHCGHEILITINTSKHYSVDIE